MGEYQWGITKSGVTIPVVDEAEARALRSWTSVRREVGPWEVAPAAEPDVSEEADHG